MTSSLLAAGAVGFALGFRHAFEPDHMAAVTTLASRGRARDAAQLGMAWAAGHTASVGIVALLLSLLQVRLPGSVILSAERLVALLLIVLGCSVLLQVRGHRRTDDHAHPGRSARTSLGFGMVHGLAGSGAVIALLVATAQGRAAQCTWFGAFAAGTTIAMLGVAAFVGLAARATTGRKHWAPALHATAGAASVIIGLLLGAGTLSG